MMSWSTVVGTTKRASSLNRPTFGVGPGLAHRAKAAAGTPTVTSEMSEAWRGAKGKPPRAVMAAMSRAL